MPAERDDAGELCLGGVRLSGFARDPAIGTPAYVYDLDAMVRDAALLEAAFGEHAHLVCYAIKANSAGPIVRAFAARGLGADIVSGAELSLALACGVAARSIVYSGVAKTDAELDLAIGAGIGAIHIESVEEIVRAGARALSLGRRARVSVRINPGLDDLDTHPYVATGHDEAKFGVALGDVPRALEAVAACAKLDLVGLASHVGSQLTQTGEYLESARILFDLARATLGRHPLEFVDTGGGFGVDYGNGCPVRPADFVRQTLALMEGRGLGHLALHVEPGRSLVAVHGVLVASVLQPKESGAHRWAMIDAGMNDLIRPALYGALHRIVSLGASRGAPVAWRVVGPVCESADDFGAHELPRPLPSHVAVLDCGAYGYTMASRYNGRALPAEVFLSGGKVAAVGARKPPEDWVSDRAWGPGPGRTEFSAPRPSHARRTRRRP